MTKPLKPLSRSWRDIIRKMAAIIVCTGIEASAVAPQYEKLTGKKYDFESSQSYLNTFLNNNPEYKRIWTLVQKDKAIHERDFLERMRRENGK